VTDTVKAAGAVSELLRTGEIAAAPGGRLALSGRALAIRQWLDRRFESLAIQAGADPVSLPALIDADTLERAGYFAAFGGRPDAYPAPAPAVCYHAYARLAGRRLDRPVRLTAAGTCMRHEPGAPPSLTRLWEFTMREVIVVGTADEVRAERARWIARVDLFALSLGLIGGMHVAADPFFAGPAQGRKLMQQLKELKYELRMAVTTAAGESESLAVASFNLHEAFFGARFDITTAAGEPAHSGCVAFGIERWMLALLAQRGLEPAARLGGC
jgi:seryl-tRNA synthetase